MLKIMSCRKISIVVNGRQKQVPTGCTLLQLLAELGIQPAGIAVEVNCRIQTGSQFATTTINESDQIEIVSLVGGG